MENLESANAPAGTPNREAEVIPVKTAAGKST
jgi:hypothetical protein